MFALVGYTFNIQFLRRIFGPTFVLHDLRLSDKHEITSRWTMSMKLTLNQVRRRSHGHEERATVCSRQSRGGNKSVSMQHIISVRAHGQIMRASPCQRV